MSMTQQSWTELAQNSPEQALTKVFWNGIDDAVVCHGDIDDHEELVRVAGTLIRELGDPAGIRTPIEALERLVAQDRSETAQSLLRDAVFTHIEEVVVDADVSSTKLRELARLIPTLLTEAKDTTSVYTRQPGVTSVVGLVLQVPEKLTDVTFTQVQRLFEAQCIETAFDCLPESALPTQEVTDR